MCVIILMILFDSFQGSDVYKRGLRRPSNSRSNSSPTQRNFYATTVLGLEGVLASELKAIGALRVEVGKNGVYFDGDDRVALKAVMHSRTALRIMVWFL